MEFFVCTMSIVMLKQLTLIIQFGPQNYIKQPRVKSICGRYASTYFWLKELVSFQVMKGKKKSKIVVVTT